MPLKNKIKIHRAIHNLTQEQLAEKVGVTRKTINTIERGHFVPSTILSLKISRVFGVPVEEVFSLDEEEMNALQLRGNK
jgi:putative transcriptional regulator